MSKKAIEIFHSILNEVDKLEKALLTIGPMRSNEVTESFTGLVNTSLKSLEGALTLLIKNTDLKTNNLNDEILNTIDYEEAKKQLQKIALTVRRIERELAINRG